MGPEPSTTVALAEDPWFILLKEWEDMS